MHPTVHSKTPHLHKGTASAVEDAQAAALTQLDHFVARSRPIDLDGIAWRQVAQEPLSPEVIRTLTCMQSIENHTVVFPRTIFSTRALTDPSIGPFLTCWLYEEGFHARALAQFLAAAGQAPPPRSKGQLTVKDRVEAIATSIFSALWRDFPALHMAWGALHEMTTLTAYRRLAALSNHPVLTDLLSRVLRDEARHFAFYYWQARERLQRPTTAKLIRFLIDRFWKPVGIGIQSTAEIRFVAGYLFSGAEGHAATRRVDAAIQRLPGFTGASPLETWISREVKCWSNTEPTTSIS